MANGHQKHPPWKLRRDAFQQRHPSLEATPSHWHSRGYLPHFDKAGTVQSFTIRLEDALPASVIEEWKRELAHTDEVSRKIEIRRRIDIYLDAGYGECWLGSPEVATMVEDALLHFDSQRYHLLAWCVMPNHLHAVVETVEGFTNAAIIHSWKSFTAHAANKILGREGVFWQREYYDREVRDGDHYESLVRYVEGNPVKAGFVTKAEDWEWSSARWDRRMPSMRMH